MKTFLTKKNTGFTRTPKFGVTPKGGGFTLVETLVAISIFTTSILAMLSILSQSISNTNYSKRKIVAQYLAQEGIECIRNIRDNYVLDGGRWSDFIVISDFDSISPCLDTKPLSSSGFTRAISMKPITTDEVKILSTVTWAQGSGPQSITFSEDLFNWVE